MTVKSVLAIFVFALFVLIAVLVVTRGEREHARPALEVDRAATQHADAGAEAIDALSVAAIDGSRETVEVTSVPTITAVPAAPAATYVFRFVDQEGGELVLPAVEVRGTRVHEGTQPQSALTLRTLTKTVANASRCVFEDVSRDTWEWTFTAERREPVELPIEDVSAEERIERVVTFGPPLRDVHVSLVDERGTAISVTPDHDGPLGGAHVMPLLVARSVAIGEPLPRDAHPLKQHGTREASGDSFTIRSTFAPCFVALLHGEQVVDCVAVAEGDDRVVLRMPRALLVRTFGTVELRAVDASSRAPLAGVDVEITPAHALPRAIVRTDVDGRGLVQRVPVGAFKAELRAPGYVTTRAKGVAATEAACELGEIALVPLRRVTGSIAGLRLEDKAIVAAFDVTKGRREAYSIEAMATTNGSAFELDGLPAGRYFLATAPPLGDVEIEDWIGDRSQTVEVDVTHGSLGGVVVPWVPASTLSGMHPPR